MIRTYAFNFSGAQADLEKAVALAPGDGDAWTIYGLVLGTSGRIDAAIAALKKATELDPLSADAWNRLAEIYAVQGNLTAARQAVGRALAIAPDSYFAYYTLAILELVQGHGAEALAAARHIGTSAGRLTMVAAAEHALGHARESNEALSELEAKYAVTSAYQVAEVYAWRGERKMAYEWLDRAWRQHDGGLEVLQIDAMFRALHGDKEYKAFLRETKLAP